LPRAVTSGLPELTQAVQALSDCGYTASYRYIAPPTAALEFHHTTHGQIQWWIGEAKTIGSRIRRWWPGRNVIGSIPRSQKELWAGDIDNTKSRHQQRVLAKRLS